MDRGQYDLNRICRTCKNVSSELKSVFDECELFDRNPRIDEMLMSCTSIEVKLEDGLPLALCLPCVEQLKGAYSFRRKCQEVDMSLRECMKTPNEDQIKQEQQASGNALLGQKEDENESERIYHSEYNLKSDYIELLDNNQMILTCRQCNKVFTTLEGLKSHKRLHTGFLFKCKYCYKGFTRLSHLNRHEMTHVKHKVHVCKICNKTLTRFEHLKRHLITHLKEKPFTCPTCNRGFNRSDHLDVHVARCKGGRCYICNICNRGFTREDSLEVHRLLHENQKPILPTIDKIDNIEEYYFEIDHDPDNVFSDSSDVDDCLEPEIEMTENDGDIKALVDSENDKIPKQESTTGNCIEIIEDNHKADQDEKQQEKSADEEDEDEEADLDNKDFLFDLDMSPDNYSDSGSSEYVPSKPKRGRGRPRKMVYMKIKTEDGNYVYKCPVCEKTFNRLTQFEIHAKQHDDLKIHRCHYCNKKFGRLYHLKRHMVSHMQSKPYACKKCPKKFAQRDSLSRHVRLHENSESLECDVCNKPFARAYQLLRHKVTRHNIGEKTTTEKKFECHICMKTFTTEKYRDVHVKGHVGGKQFKCRTCEKSFLSKSHLNEHMKFHNDNSKKFLCSECGQRFIRNDYLVIHMRRHRGEKPFKCKYCGKGFPRTTDLTVHERYHTGEKTHLCTICGRGFGRAYNLTVHMRTHTGEKPYQCTYCDSAFAQGNDLKAHVRRHTGERFQCELCAESFLMGYLLTQHKRSVHGLNVVSNIRRLQPVHKLKENPDEPPPITIPLPKPVVPDNVLNNLHMATPVCPEIKME